MKFFYHGYFFVAIVMTAFLVPVELWRFRFAPSLVLFAVLLSLKDILQQL
jgi:hypothetical protein